MFFSRASIRPDIPVVRHFAISGLLDGSLESDHKLAWMLFADSPEATRDFQFVVTDRRPFSLEMLSVRRPACEIGHWNIETREADLSATRGERFNLTTTAVLTRSKVASKGSRGTKHDLVSAAHYDLRAGCPWPEVSHLGADASRADLVQPVTLAWFWRSAEQLGFVPAQGNDGVPLFHAEISPASRERGAKTAGTSIRAIDVRSQIVVRDEDTFRRSLVSGIGRSKAYGYGMLRVVRAGGMV